MSCTSILLNLKLIFCGILRGKQPCLSQIKIIMPRRRLLLVPAVRDEERVHPDGGQHGADGVDKHQLMETIQNLEIQLTSASIFFS